MHYGANDVVRAYLAVVQMYRRTFLEATLFHGYDVVGLEPALPVTGTMLWG